MDTLQARWLQSQWSRRVELLFGSLSAILRLQAKQDEAIVFPEIEEDLWIEPEDLYEIDLAIAHIINNMREELTAIHVMSPPKVGTALLRASEGTLVSSAREIRADTSGTRPNLRICLIGFPTYEYQAEYKQLAADPSGLKEALRPVLAHEAAHVRQIERGGPDMNDARAAASEANKKAAETKRYTDYIAYVGHGIEIAAHATQLAVEVLATATRITTESEFEQAALKTWLWSHVESNPTGHLLSADERANIFSAVRERLLKNGWFAYRRVA